VVHPGADQRRPVANAWVPQTALVVPVIHSVRGIGGGPIMQALTTPARIASDRVTTG
jgi:hypothetical protein